MFARDFFCKRESLPCIREFIRLHLSELEDITSNQIILAVDEVCANAIIHGRGRKEPFQLKISILSIHNQITVEITDTAEPYPIPIPTQTSAAEKIKMRAKGGLGLVLVQKIMDQIEIERLPDAHIIRMIKRI
jgi:serine/threonine-protein kinase RsbW